MKSRKDKTERSAESASQSRRNASLPVRSARRAPVHGEVLAAGKKDDSLQEYGSEESPISQPERPYISLRGSLRFVVNPDENRDTKDSLDQKQSIGDPSWEEYLDMDISSSDFESLTEYSAEMEVEAAMLEAELAMQTDESALMFEEGMEVFEMAKDGVSLVWEEEGAEIIEVE